MEKEVYLQKLEERLSYYYDIEKNISTIYEDVF